MKKNIAIWLVGFNFALGLGLSGMTQPQKVIGFLDIFHNWDPSLMFVMLGSVLVHFISYKIIRKQPYPLFSKIWHIPEKKKITPSLIIGSTIFGIGWGLAGYCPGPAITSIASLQKGPIIFVFGMLLGMLIFKILDRKIKFNR